LTAHDLETEIAVVDDYTGLPIGYLLPEIPDDAPSAVREGLVRRRLTALEGRCPCGAGVAMPNRAARRRAVRSGVPARILVEHEADCAASDRMLSAAMGRWAR